MFAYKIKFRIGRSEHELFLRLSKIDVLIISAVTKSAEWPIGELLAVCLTL